MNKHIYALVILAIAMVTVACSREEDDIFDASAAQRLEQGADEARARLLSSTGGWTMEYYPTDDTTDPYGMGYLILVNFFDNGSTTMAMNNQFSNNQYVEDTSMWDIITDNGVVLTFNTYNKCIHAFCDPEDVSFTTSTDETGYGCEGDYEFIMVDVTDDTTPEYMMIKGKKRGLYIRLSRLEEGTVFEDYMADVQEFNTTMFPSSAPNYLVLTIGDDQMEVDDIATGIPNIYPFGTDAIANECYYPYIVFRHNGRYCLRFRDEVVSQNNLTTQELVYDEQQDCFFGIDDETVTLNGPIPQEFFLRQMSEGNAWQVRRSSEMSEAAADLYEQVYSGLSAMRYTLQYVRLATNDDGDYLCSFNVRASGGASTTISYRYTMVDGDDGLTLTYVEPTNDAAGNVLGNLPVILDFLTAFNGTNTLSAATTRFNLSDVRLTTANSDIWFITTLN